MPGPIEKDIGRTLTPRGGEISELVKPTAPSSGETINPGIRRGRPTPTTTGGDKSAFPLETPGLPLPPLQAADTYLPAPPDTLAHLTQPGADEPPSLTGAAVAFATAGEAIHKLGGALAHVASEATQPQGGRPPLSKKVLPTSAWGLWNTMGGPTQNVPGAHFLSVRKAALTNKAALLAARDPDIQSAFPETPRIAAYYTAETAWTILHHKAQMIDRLLTSIYMRVALISDTKQSSQLKRSATHLQEKHQTDLTAMMHDLLELSGKIDRLIGSSGITPASPEAAQRTRSMRPISPELWDRNIWDPLKGRDGELAIDRAGGDCKVVGRTTMEIDGVTVDAYEVIYPRKPFPPVSRPADQIVIKGLDPAEYHRVEYSRMIQTRQLPELFTLRFFHHHIPELRPLIEEEMGENFALATVRVMKLFRTTSGAAPLPGFKGSYQRVLTAIYTKTGIDPIAFALAFANGEIPNALITPRTAKERQRTNTIDYVADMVFTPDRFRAFLIHRPWLSWLVPTGKVNRVQSAGYLYTSAYKETNRPHDLSDLYYLREQTDPASQQRLLDESVRQLAPLATQWSDSMPKASKVIVAIPSGASPTNEIAHQLSTTLTIPTKTPWHERPADYGKGVEGKTSFRKLQIVRQALKLRSDADGIKGKHVLLIDDNITDGISYMVAREALMAAGALSVSLVTLTRTIRSQEQLEFYPL